jgi:hypothetical protein
MTTEIVSSEDSLKSIQDEFEDLNIPYYKFRNFFSVNERVFFECEEGETFQCLYVNLKRKDHDYFVVFLLVEDIDSGELLVMDVRFPNIGGESLEHFIDRYDSQLKTSGVMSLEASGKELMNVLGYSYEN